MNDRTSFLNRLNEDRTPTIEERAIALLWYYGQKQEFEERSVKELAQDLADEGYGHINQTRLHKALKKSPYTVRGNRKDTVRISAAHFSTLTRIYGPLIDLVEIEVSSSVIPFEYVDGSRVYLEQLVKQINGCYDKGFYDGCAVLVRRLVESLIIEVYAHKKMLSAVKSGNDFVGLERLITVIASDASIPCSRSFRENSVKIKDLGDTAAHDRFYVTQKNDIDENKQHIQKVANELLQLSGIR